MVKFTVFLAVETDCNTCKCNYSVWIGRAHQDFPIARVRYALHLISNSMKILLATTARPRWWWCHFKGPKWIPYDCNSNTFMHLTFVTKQKFFEELLPSRKFIAFALNGCAVRPCAILPRAVHGQQVKYVNVKCGNCAVAWLLQFVRKKFVWRGRAWVGSSHIEIMDFVHREHTESTAAARIEWWQHHAQMLTWHFEPFHIADFWLRNGSNESNEIIGFKF